MIKDMIYQELADQILPYRRELLKTIMEHQRAFKYMETKPSVRLDGRKRKLCFPS